MTQKHKVREYPICPHCGDPVYNDPHELQLQLVNAYVDAPKEHVNLHDIFHAKCAATVWNAARDEWYAKGKVIA